MQPGQTQPTDPLQLLIGKHIVYLDKNHATRTGRLTGITNRGCTVEQKITIVKQKNGRRYPPIRHRIDRNAITGVLSRNRKKTLPLKKINARIVKNADEKGIELNHDQMPTLAETITFSKKMCKSEIFHGFLVIAKKCKLDVGDPVTVRMNGWRIRTHVQKVHRIWMTKEMRENNIKEGDVLNFHVVKKAGNTVVTVTKEKDGDEE